MFYHTRDSRSMSSVTRRTDFIMQNHSVKKWETLLCNTHTKKKLFWLNIFKSYVHVTFMFFADKNKANSIPLL
jgi:ferric iron reductase protein FhuF